MHPIPNPVYDTDPYLDPYNWQYSQRDQERINEAYYQGVTWQFWIGPLPPAKDPKSTAAITELQKVFQRSNKVRECIERHVSALVGDPYHWYLIDENQERVEAPENEKQVQSWINWVAESAIAAKDSTDPWWKCVRDMVVRGRGYLRLWMPKKYANDPDLVHRIHLHSPDPANVKIDRDDEGFVEAIEYSYGTNQKERQTMNDDGSLTIVVSESGMQIDSYRLDLGGRWTIYELRSDSLITEDVKDAQNNINLAKTMQSRTLIQNGFVERVLMNAQLPGQWVDDDSQPTGQRFVPDPDGLQVGAGITSFIQGTPTYDELGRVSGYASPSINYKDPAPVDSFQVTIAGDVEQIYHSMGQGHLLGNESVISGASRTQMRQDSEVKSQRHEKTIKAAFSGILGGFLEAIGVKNFTAVVELRKSTHWLAPEEQTQIIAAYNAGLVSQATAIAKLGMVDDVDAEMAMLEEEAKKAAALIPQPKLPGDTIYDPNADPAKQNPGNEKPSPGKEEKA